MNAITHQFVDFIPDHLEEGVLYVSLNYRTVTHRCCCGCGLEVVTPLAPKAWRLTFDGESISLRPSIGNWNLPCRSHYWIQENGVQWVKDSKRSPVIDDLVLREKQHKKITQESESPKSKNPKKSQKRGVWGNLWRKFTSK